MNVKYDEGLTVDWNETELGRIRELKDEAARTQRVKFSIRRPFELDPAARIVRDVLEGRA